MNIDPTTGLPELPDGHRWRVTTTAKPNPNFAIGEHWYDPNKQRLYGSYPWMESDSKLRVLIEKAKIEEYAQSISNPEYRWWNNAPKTMEATEQRVRWYETKYFAVTNEISEADVLNAAKLAINAMHLDEIKSKLKDSLIGIYPPKGLEEK